MIKSADGRFEYLDKDGDPLPEGSGLADVGRFQFECRSSPGSHCSINIANAGYQIENRNWKLTGTLDSPTIAPSINCSECWHGFIENGVFVNTEKKKEDKQ